MCFILLCNAAFISGATERDWSSILLYNAKETVVLFDMLSAPILVLGPDYVR
jgi:hypothetical protein